MYSVMNGGTVHPCIRCLVDMESIYVARKVSPRRWSDKGRIYEMAERIFMEAEYMQRE